MKPYLFRRASSAASFQVNKNIKTTEKFSQSNHKRAHHAHTISRKTEQAPAKHVQTEHRKKQLTVTSHDQTNEAVNELQQAQSEPTQLEATIAGTNVAVQAKYRAERRRDRVFTLLDRNHPMNVEGNFLLGFHEYHAAQNPHAPHAKARYDLDQHGRAHKAVSEISESATQLLDVLGLREQIKGKHIP